MQLQYHIPQRDHTKSMAYIVLLRDPSTVRLKANTASLQCVETASKAVAGSLESRLLEQLDAPKIGLFSGSAIWGLFNRGCR